MNTNRKIYLKRGISNCQRLKQYMDVLQSQEEALHQHSQTRRWSEHHPPQSNAPMQPSRPSSRRRFRSRQKLNAGSSVAPTTYDKFCHRDIEVQPVERNEIILQGSPRYLATRLGYTYDSRVMEEDYRSQYYRVQKRRMNRVEV